MRKPDWSHAGVDLYLGDCLEILPELEAGVIITDPPYPDYHVEKYRYKDGILNPLVDKDCKQLIFWTSKVDFPLDFTAVHIWDKKTGVGSQYERIFERNGGKEYKVYRYYLINSTVAASYTGDDFTGHTSQKPIRLLRDLVTEHSAINQLISDPFMGSGTTGVACVQTGRRFVGIEIEPKYFEIAVKRISQAQLQIRMDL